MFSPAPRRVVDPPVPVVVDVLLAIGQSGERPANELPLRVRAEGLNVDCRVPGLLSAWARTVGGGWLAYLTFSIPTGNGLGALRVAQWCPSAAAVPLPRPPNSQLGEHADEGDPGAQHQEHPARADP